MKCMALVHNIHRSEMVAVTNEADLKDLMTWLAEIRRSSDH